MPDHDVLLLGEMRRAITAYTDDVGRLADELLMLRDGLEFDDPAWSQEVTRHIVTLDSASTFVPANDEEEQQLRSAISSAIDALLELIGTKEP